MNGEPDIDLSQQASASEVTEPGSSHPIFSDAVFDKILSEVDSMMSSTETDAQIDKMPPALDEAGDEADQTDSEREISDETREALFAEGYMQGSLEQKEVMEKRLIELQKTVTDLKIAAATPAFLSEEINASIGQFIQSVASSVLNELKTSYLAEIVESRVKAFVSDVKGWELATYVHCSEHDYLHLIEIFGIDAATHLTHNGIHYRIDQALQTGRFRLEVQKENEPNIEAVMDINAHLANISEQFNEAI
ncbi:hypothetical protein KCN56_11470 [Photobacterium galatheae]|uniref:hypothetical protein n=1 Tax=Photobacterium galatheae TaxID=1654360 RepID=UPI0012690061|nr:hypothetical protein [Photobacterium galatheae]MCM0149180.1 hypothetical protein [Photobacterium galatheae]